MTAGALPQVRAELLLPHEIDAALARRSVVYVPLGSLEYHGEHLPIGLDGLTVHGICVRAAARSGGIVLPPLYCAVGGEHTRYPWTIMADSDVPLRDLLRQTLARLEAFGVRTAVLFTGHFADEQIAVIEDLAGSSNARTSAMRVLPLAVNRSGAAVPPDHAGRFEASLLAALHPDRVDLDRLGSFDEAARRDLEHGGGYGQRHDPDHPLYGVFGPDPRPFDATTAAELLEHLVAWTVGCVEVDDGQARGRPSAR
ncbi:MAG TPA: creatininase family protein [Kineosporiaceae bacterium]|nr:creatininase family protein [Kineosporiaceae bacterium]